MSKWLVIDADSGEAMPPRWGGNGGNEGAAYATDLNRKEGRFRYIVAAANEYRPPARKTA